MAEVCSKRKYISVSALKLKVGAVGSPDSGKFMKMFLCLLGLFDYCGSGAMSGTAVDFSSFSKIRLWGGGGIP